MFINLNFLSYLSFVTGHLYRQGGPDTRPAGLEHRQAADEVPRQVLVQGGVQSVRSTEHGLAPVLRPRGPARR